MLPQFTQVRNGHNCYVLRQLQGFPSRMCSINLHVCAAHLHVMEEQHGPLALQKELWIERAIGRQKHVCEGRISRWPERLIVANDLLRQALLRTAATKSIRDFDRLVLLHTTLVKSYLLTW
jgi:hypothetical protein